jgi:AcrR family transcriptional regulator
LSICSIEHLANYSLPVKMRALKPRAMPRLAAPDRLATLVEATAAIMVEKGFAGATTRDVAARLGIGRGLLHHYFDSWEALQRTAFQAVEDAARAETLVAIEPLSGWDRLATLLDLLIAEPDDAHWRLYADAWDEAQRDPELATIVANINAWWRDLLCSAIRPLLNQRISADDGAERLLALAVGLSAQVLMTDAVLPRARAVALLHDAARMELAVKPHSR